MSALNIVNFLSDFSLLHIIILFESASYQVNIHNGDSTYHVVSEAPYLYVILKINTDYQFFTIIELVDTI